MTVGESAPWPVTRTFKPRRRGMSEARTARYEPALARWALPTDGPVLDLSTVFGTDGPFVMEVGFGGGESVVELAGAPMDACFIAIDVYTPGIATVLEAIEANGWQHVRVVDGDALDFLPRLASQSLDEVRVWFPDPWPKARQQRRRIIRPEITGMIVDRLRVGGVLHLATDIADYAEQMAAVCDGEPRLTGGEIERPAWRPLTRYEQRGIEAGRDVVDLVYRRIT